MNLLKKQTNMKKQLLSLIIILMVVLQSCSKPAEDVKLEKYDLTITVPKLSKQPEFTDLKLSERDTELSRYDFNVGKPRINIIEIVPGVYPTDINMLKKVIATDEDFVEITDTKELKNGAFGVIFKKKGSSGTVIKEYLFYFKKGTRYFKMEPVFNSELKGLDDQISAYESLK